MDFLLLWLGLNLPVPLIIIAIITLRYKSKTDKVMGFVFGAYAFPVMLLPCLGVAALIKYLS